MADDLQLRVEEAVQATQTKDRLEIGLVLALDLHSLCILKSDDALSLSQDLGTLSISLNLSELSLSLTLSIQLSLEHLCLCAYLSGFELGSSLDSCLLSLSLFVDFTDTLRALGLDDLQFTLSDRQLTVHVLVLLHPLLSSDLFDDLEVFVIAEDSDLVLLLGPLVLVHGAILSFLIEGLCDVLGQSHILEDDASELQALVLKHLV